MSQQYPHDQLPEDDAQIPGASAETAAPEDYVESKPRVNNSTVALIGAFAAALIVLYLLGLQNKPRAAVADTHEIELTARIDKILGSNNEQVKMGNFFDASSRLVAKLQNRFDDRALAVEIEGNPFEHVIPKPAPPPVSTAPDLTPRGPVEDPAIKAARAALLRQVAADYDSLRLDAIMLGPRPVALIKGRSVTIGDQLGHLTVKDIQQGQVLLTFEDQTFRLEDKKPK
jgi:hypothetical protein